MHKTLAEFIKSKLQAQYNEILNNLGTGRIGGKENYEKITGILECLKVTYETNIDIIIADFEKLNAHEG